MNVDLGETRVRKELEMRYKDGFSPCICEEKGCERYFFQKSTLLKVLNPFLEKYNELPLNVKLRSIKDNRTGFMTVTLIIEQTGDILGDNIG